MVADDRLSEASKPEQKEFIEKGNDKEDLCEVTAAIGSWGRWQFRIFVILSLTGIVNCWHMLVIQFYAPNADHWCSPPDGPYKNWTVEQWKNYSIPPDPKVEDSFSRCEMYDRNYSMIPSQLEFDKKNLSKVDCKHGWDFDTSQFTKTIEKEWTLVCDREALAKTGASAYYGGVLVGVLGFGQLSDMIGRKKCLMITVTVTLLSGLITAFMPYLELFFVTRFFVATGAIGSYTTAFVLIMELVDGKWRVIGGVGREYFWCFGYVSLTAIGYFIPGWRNIQLFISIPVVFLFLYWWYVPESPRWLLCHGRRKEAYDILKVAAKENRRETPYMKEHINIKEEEEEKDEHKSTLIDLFRYSVLRYRTLNLYFNWFVVAFVYYGLSLGTNNLGGNIFINFFIAGAIEIPAITLSIYLLMKKGRRIPHCAFMILGGVACLGTAAFEKGQYKGDWPIVTLAMIGKFGIAGSFAIVYVYSAELFPTVVRNVGVGSSSLFARVGSMIAPYVDLSRHLHPAIPLVIYGSFSVVSGILILLLPETKNQPLPQTIQDAERLSRNDKKGCFHW